MVVDSHGGGEGDNENATLLEMKTCFGGYVAFKEMFNISKSILISDYKDERIFAGAYKL